MNDANELSSILQELHARLARLEMATLAMCRGMAAQGALPPSFASTFAEELQSHAQNVHHEQFSSKLIALGAQWQPVFDALTRDSANR